MSRNLLIPLLFAILMVNTLAPVVENTHILEANVDFLAGSGPQQNDHSYTDNGNGTAANSFWVGNSTQGIQDTWMSSAHPDAIFGNDIELRTGYSANASSRWNTLFGINLNQAG
ncbi:MAG TPA: hypothetical protein QF433_01345, partial [Candidatus Thalassarchaeaceae archaeon]|nr:hypothetical protein [Candidatus Thalassarchaeaceae archaeon]